MYKNQRELTVGYVADILETWAVSLSGSVPDLNEMGKARVWAKVTALLKARDSLEWAVKQVATWKDCAAKG